MRKTFFGLMLVFACMVAVADQVVLVATEKLNVRAAPSTKAVIVGQVSRDDRLIVIPVSDGWARIDSHTGTNGFVSRRYLRLTDNGTRPQVIQNGTGGIVVALVLIALLITALLVFVRACQLMGRRGHPVLGFFVNLILAGSGFGWILLIVMAVQESRERGADRQRGQNLEQ